jgi:ubiquinone/menaquinone biosynthesis C-methylase UbiE
MQATHKRTDVIEDRSRAFWNEAARDNAYWYVSSVGNYAARRDMAEFWASGGTIWADLKNAIGYAPAPTHHVVEIGCGVGRMTRAVAPEVAHVDSFDVSTEMLDKARSAGLPNATFHLGEGFNLKPLPNATADAVIAYCVFQHLPTEEALASYLAEMVRVAKPGGIIAFTLTPRSAKYYFLPLLRLRAFVREKLGAAGPKGVYKRAWVGIRPTVTTVESISPVPLRHVRIHGDKWLFWGRK